MIRSVKIENHRGETLDLDLFNPWASGIAIRNIEGLGPPQAVINMTELSTVDGSVFNSSRAQSRTIDLDFILVEKPTIESSRHIVYKYFPIKKPITIYVTTDEREVYTTGYVESVIPTIFSDMEGVQITVRCPDPYFYSLSNNVTYLNAVLGGFEFPFTNPVNTYSLKFGEMSSGDATNIFYNGETSIGIDIEIHFIGPVNTIRLYNMTTNQELLIDTARISEIVGSPIRDGDLIKVNTKTGKKSIILNRNGTIYNILSCLSRDTRWIQLERGDNVFVYSAVSGVNNLLITITNKELFEGV